MDVFNKTCKKMAASYLEIVNESKSAINFRPQKRGITSLVLYFRKTEPMGAEFKTVACSVTGFMILLDIQIGN